MRRFSVLLSFFFLLALTVVLAGCSGAEEPPTTMATPTLGAAPNFITPDEALAGTPAAQTVTIVGYYYLGSAGPVLVDGLSFSGDAPQPLSPEPAKQLWLGDTPTMPEAVRQGYTPVLARGVIEGPARYGPGGRYAFQLTGGSLRLLAPLELSLHELLARAFVYDGQLVRVQGELVLSPQSALLVERLNAGGVPPGDARQVKLLPPFRDEALRARLAGSSGVVRYGPVEVEGFWRGGALLVLGVRAR